MNDNHNSSPASDISKAAPLLAQKSWSLEFVLFTPGLMGNITVNMKDFLSTTPVLMGYMYVGQVYRFCPFFAFCFP